MPPRAAPRPAHGARASGRRAARRREPAARACPQELVLALVMRVQRRVEIGEPLADELAARRVTGGSAVHESRRLRTPHRNALCRMRMSSPLHSFGPSGTGGAVSPGRETYSMVIDEPPGGARGRLVISSPEGPRPLATAAHRAFTLPGFGQSATPIQANPSGGRTPKMAVPSCPAAGGRNSATKKTNGIRPSRPAGGPPRDAEDVRLERVAIPVGRSPRVGAIPPRKRRGCSPIGPLTDGWRRGVAATRTSRSSPTDSRVCATSPRAPVASAWTTYIAGRDRSSNAAERQA